jgi:hypothetical protein
MTITPELRHEIEQAGAVRIEDPETHAAYVVLKAEVYERMKPLLENCHEAIPGGIRRSQDAFFRDLPELLKDESLLGQCVAYCGDERIGIAPSDERERISGCVYRVVTKDRKLTNCFWNFYRRPQN